MARSFTNLNLVSSLILARRGYAATSKSQAVAAKAGTGSLSGKMVKKSAEDKVTDKVSWAPDPVTGYYKPENCKDVDVAELRSTLLGKKFNN